MLNRGTTCLGAKELNRSFIGIEKEVKYYELAVCRVFPTTESIYKNIQSKGDYDKLLSSGMFWEFHPELSGSWDIDRVAILKTNLSILNRILYENGNINKPRHPA